MPPSLSPTTLSSHKNVSLPSAQSTENDLPSINKKKRSRVICSDNDDDDDDDEEEDNNNTTTSNLQKPSITPSKDSDDEMIAVKPGLDSSNNPIEIKQIIPKSKNLIVKREPTTTKSEHPIVKHEPKTIKSENSIPQKKKKRQPPSQAADKFSDSEDEPIVTPKKSNKKPKLEKDKPSTTTTTNSKKKRSSKNNSLTSDMDSSTIDNSTSTATTKSENLTPVKSKAKAKTKKSKLNSQSPSKELDNEEEEGDGMYKWWQTDNSLGDGTTKWKTLQHNGIIFPPEWEPHGIKMKYDGKEVNLQPDAEEVATYFAGVIGTSHEQNQTFVTNFWADFTTVLRQSTLNPIMTEFKKCDFTPIFDHLTQLKEQRKLMTKEEKAAIKEQKDLLDEKYGVAIVDGRKEKVGNYRIEPPGLFRGRGAHPKTGKLKARITPEQITLNIGEEAKVPEAPPGHQWASVQHDHTVTWLATWKENINGNIKYVFLAANSAWKGQSDFGKFEKARQLKKYIQQIRQNYKTNLKSLSRTERQLAVAMYFIDCFALRAGSEKGENEADTVGCCSLRAEHVILEEDNRVIFDFLGKDSIRYYNEVIVDAQVHKNLRLFKKNKKDDQPVFDCIDVLALNKHLSSLMPGLSAKVFRTFNASITFEKELLKTPADGTLSEKILAYNRANREVAVLCNHQKSVSKSHAVTMEKLRDKVRGFKYQLREVKQHWIKLDPQKEKTMPELLELESDLEEDWITDYLKQEVELEKEKDIKRLARLNEKRRENGDTELTDLPPTKPLDITMTIEKCEKKYAQLKDRLQVIKNQEIDKDENKTTALSTSKLNYIDPRITSAWCYKHNVPIEKLFAKTLRNKFQWALDVDADWGF